MTPQQHMPMEDVTPCTVVRDRYNRPLELQRVAVKAEVDDALYTVSVEQHFFNPNTETLEILYGFPVPWDSQLLEVEAWLGERRLTAVVREKTVAAMNYENALAQGDTAILLEDRGNGQWHVSLGNLAPRETCRLHIRYARELRFSGDTLRLVVPTVIAPRYANQPVTEPWQSPSPDLLAEYPFAITVRITGALTAADIHSPSHAIQVTTSEDGREITLGGPAWLDRDFVLGLSGFSEHALATGAKTPKGHGVVMAGFCPRLPQVSARPRRIKVLVDCSSSMAGNSIRMVRQALTDFIAGMTDQDHMTFSRFGSTCIHAGYGFQPMDLLGRQFGWEWVEKLEADLGGTEMSQALRSVFALDMAAKSDVLLLTDGAIEAVDETIAAARNSGQRVFVVGIGLSPAESLLRELAEATGGACEWVAAPREISGAMVRMSERLGAQRVNRLRLQWPSPCDPEWQSVLPATVFDGDTLLVHARFRKPVTGQIRLLGVPEDGADEICLGEVPVISGGDPDVLMRVIAASEARALLRRGERKQALILSLEHRLLNELTAAVMVLERADGEKCDDLPRQVVIRQMMPAGWGGVGIVCHHFISASVMDMPGITRSPILQNWKSADSKPKSSGPVTRLLSSLANRLFPNKPAKADGGLVDTTDAGFVCRPINLVRRVRRIPREEWPTTFAGLRQLRVDWPVIHWLKQAAGPELGLDDAGMIALFLEFLSLEGLSGWLAGIEDLRLDGFPEGSPMRRLVRALKGMDKDRWPECVGMRKWVER